MGGNFTESTCIKACAQSTTCMVGDWTGSPLLCYMGTLATLPAFNVSSSFVSNHFYLDYSGCGMYSVEYYIIYYRIYIHIYVYYV